MLERQKNEDIVKMSNLSGNVAESLENLRNENRVYYFAKCYYFFHDKLKNLY